MRPGIIKTIFFKEIRETLRDRRTLFLMVFLPILLYPGLMLVITQVAAVQIGKIKGSKGIVAITGGAPRELVRQLEQDRTLRLVAAPKDPKEALQAGELQVWIDLPPGVEATLRRGKNVSLKVYFDQASDLSRDILRRTKKRLASWREEVLKLRLAGHRLAPDFIKPLSVVYTNLAPPKKVGGYLLAQFVPVLIILTVILGAFYPAIDLTAGEKERGTLQTLLTAPIRNTEVVVGKFLAVVAIAFFSGFFNVLSLGLVFSHNLFLTGVDLNLSISLGTIGLLFLVIVVMGFFFSALMMTVAVLARSFKEAQNYLTPVYLVCLIPVIITQLPGMELSSALSVIPAINVSLLLKQILLGQLVLDQFFIVLTSTAGYTVLILLLAAKIFDQETIMLGEKQGIRLLLTVGPTGRRPAPTPTEAVFVFCCLFLLLYYVGAWLQKMHLMGGLLLTQYLLLLLPVVGFLFWQKIDIPGTLSLNYPRGRSIGAAILLGMSAWLILVVWQEIQNKFLPLPPAFAKSMAELLNLPPGPAGILLLFFAVSITPAICEEIVFRGLLLGAFRTRMSERAAVLLSAVAFGLFHLSIYRFAGTFILGLVLGLVAIRSGSILLAMLLHGLHNGMVLALSLWGSEWLGWIPGHGLPGPWLFAGCSGAFALGLLLLLPQRQSPEIPPPQTP